MYNFYFLHMLVRHDISITVELLNVYPNITYHKEITREKTGENIITIELNNNCKKSVSFFLTLTPHFRFIVLYNLDGQCYKK